MATAPTPSADDEYEDLLSHWLDLESALAMLLTHPRQVRDFALKVRQGDLWLQDIIGHDTDAALYLMFQLATTSVVGYSASHALVCTTLCHLLARELRLPASERDALVHAAVTMNIGMTVLQNDLALQREPLTAEQKQAIARHPVAGAALLGELGIRDDLWLDVVAHHHDAPASAALERLPIEQRLALVLATTDRYAAMISPRKSRPGRSTSDSVRAIADQGGRFGGDVAQALARTVGAYPPGTFVRLDNDETAVVLRRGDRPDTPLVATVIDAHGKALARPRLHQTAGTPRVRSALARAAITMEVNHRAMVRLGLYTAVSTVGVFNSAPSPEKT